MMNYGADNGYAINFEANTWEDDSEAYHPKISIQEVQATRALFTKLCMEQTHSVMLEDKKYGFALINTMMSNQDSMYDGSTEQYFAGRVEQVEDDQWRMRLRFRHNKLSEDAKNHSEIDDYQFHWLDNENRSAWYGHYTLDAQPEATYEAWTGITPITPEINDDLHDRMRLHVSQGLAAITLKELRRVKHFRKSERSWS